MTNVSVSRRRRSQHSGFVQATRKLEPSTFKRTQKWMPRHGRRQLQRVSRYEIIQSKKEGGIASAQAKKGRLVGWAQPNAKKTCSFLPRKLSLFAKKTFPFACHTPPHAAQPPSSLCRGFLTPPLSSASFWRLIRFI